MHQNETISQVSSPARKQKKIYPLLLSGAMLLYIVFVCLNEEFSSNIVYTGTMLLEITEWSYLGVEILAFFVAYAYVIYVLFAHGTKQALQYAKIYAIILAARSAVLYLLNWLVFGLKTEDLLFQGLMTLLSLVLELCQYAVMFWIAHRLISRYNRLYEVMEAGANRLSQQPTPRSHLIFPYRKVALKNDPLRFSAFLIALILGAIRIISRIIYDFSYGAPGDIGDLLWMIAYYTTDVLIGVAGYFVMLYIVRRLTLSSETTK